MRLRLRLRFASVWRRVVRSAPQARSRAASASLQSAILFSRLRRIWRRQAIPCLFWRLGEAGRDVHVEAEPAVMPGGVSSAVPAGAEQVPAVAGTG